MKKISILLFLCLVGLSCNKKPEVLASSYDTLLNISPNPTFSTVSINVQNTSGQSYNLKVFNPASKLLLEKEITPGVQNFDINLTDTGTYEAVLITEKATVRKKFIRI